jgi:tetratricopeptide (TPR) repeat protein
MGRPSCPPRRDIRLRAVALTVAGVVAGGALIQHALAPTSGATIARADPVRSPAAHAAEARAREIDVRFQQAALMLHAGQHEHAAAALHRLLELAPRMPEAHVNMGFALVGLKQAAAARDFFATAIELNPMQANAYYGLAVAADALGDRPAAVGAMRSYLHLAQDADPRHLSKARAALWEWEAEARGAQPAGAPGPLAP